MAKPTLAYKSVQDVDDFWENWKLRMRPMDSEMLDTNALFGVIWRSLHGFDPKLRDSENARMVFDKFLFQLRGEPFNEALYAKELLSRRIQ